MNPTRRRFLGSAAALAAAASVSWQGYRRLNRRPTVSLDKVGLPMGHQLRDGSADTAAVSEHRCQTLILGSGAAGLTAAWYLAKHGRRDFLLADGIERNGNNAACHYHGADAPTGAHYLAQPSRESSHVAAMLSDFGMVEGKTADGRPVYRDTDLVHAPDERLLFQNRWQDGLIPQQDSDSRRFFALIRQLKHARGRDGRKLFAIPLVLSSQDAEWRQTDRETFARWLDRQNLHSPALRWYLDYCCRDDYGQGIDRVSAFAGLHYFAARGNEQAAVLTWPDGLNHLSEQLRRHAGLKPLAQLPENRDWHFAEPASCAVTALRIRERGDDVEVLLRHNRDGRTVKVSARRVICAMPLMVAARIIEFPERYGFQAAPLPFAYAPWLVANFVLHRFPEEAADSELAWDNVVYGTGGLGYVAAGHQYIRAAKPEHTIFTAYRALNHAPPAAVRRQLLDADADDLLAVAAEDLLHAYGTGFWQHVSHVAITARAHGMAVPQPGFLDLPLLASLRQHHSKIVFAHSDLSGYSVFEEAAYWGVAAAQKILAGRTA